MRIEIEARHLIGVYRDMWMEYLQRKGIEHANHLSVGVGYGNWPSSILKMRELIEDVAGITYHAHWLNNIFTDYNGGRRA